MFKRILSALGGKKGAATPANDAPPASTPASGKELITVHDAYGRELKITRHEWQENVLKPNLKLKWNEPDALYSMIVSALDDGFAPELLPTAQRLQEIDPSPERGHTILGIVLMKNGMLDAAEATLREGIRKVGETGALLNNLAKVFSERGDQAQADDTLWRALQTDPNLENSLLWWAAIQRERGGDVAYLQALRTASELPGSWLAKLWLARHFLENKELDAARALYVEVLSGGWYNGGALMMISGDLGNNGQVQWIVDLVGPVFDEHKHDPMAGLNLLRACHQLGKVSEGEALLNRMYALSIAPLKPHLDEFAKAFQALQQAHDQGRPIDPDKLQVSTLSLSQPIWHYGLRNADWLFAQKPQESPEVGFFAFSKILDGSERAEEQREDDLGRLTRAIPLYLAEAAHYWSDYAASCYILVVEGGGPVVSGGETDGAGLFDIVPPSMKYFVTGEIGRVGEGDAAQWRIALSLWDCSTRSKQASESGSASQEALGSLVLTLEQRLLDHIGLKRDQPLDDFYLRPNAEVMPVYLMALGQALILTLVANEHMPKSVLWGERAMLDWPLNMALQSPTVDLPKLMYISSLGKALDYHSDVLPEYEARSLALLEDAQRAHSVAARLAPLVWKAFGMDEALREHTQGLPADAMPGYAAWVERVRA